MNNFILEFVTKYKVSLIAITMIIFAYGFYLSGASSSNENIRFVNLHDAVSIPVSIFSKADMPKSSQQEVLKRYTRNLLPTIKKYAKQKHVTVISSNVVADENALDITNEIIKINLKEVSS